MTVSIDYRGPAIWAKQDGDTPITITDYMGEGGGGCFFEIAESKTGIPVGEVRLPLPTLLPHHSKMLQGDSAIADEVIEQRGYRSVTDSQELVSLGFEVLFPRMAEDGR